MVTVVDAVNFLKDYDDAKSLHETGESLGEEDERSVADLLVDQVEFADLILISKCDLAGASDVERLSAILKTLNTDAKIVPISHGQVKIDEVLNTGLFDFARAQQAPGWLKEMRGEHVPETEEYGISNFVYERRIPFHPERLNKVFSQEWPGVIRSKGLFWLATRLEMAGYWSQAGAMRQNECFGFFWKAVPREHWPKRPRANPWPPAKSEIAKGLHRGRSGQ